MRERERASSRGHRFTREDFREIVESNARSFLTTFDVRVAIEKRTLLGEDEQRSAAVTFEFDSRERHGDARVVEMHFVREHEPFVRHDVEVPTVVRMYRAFGRS